MLGLGPLFSMVLEPRMVPRWARKRFGRKIIATDIALIALWGGLCALVGWRAVLFVQLTPALLAGAVGIWLFYVQHQFEGVYWERGDEWSYAASALHGSSHLRLPKLAQFFTGNIGLHHVHHLHARIPNYNLQRAHDENAIFHDVREIGAWEAVLALRLKLYDEHSGRLVGFAHARHTRSRRAFRRSGVDGGRGAIDAERRQVDELHVGQLAHPGELAARVAARALLHRVDVAAQQLVEAERDAGGGRGAGRVGAPHLLDGARRRPSRRRAARCARRARRGRARGRRGGSDGACRRSTAGSPWARRRRRARPARAARARG